MSIWERLFGGRSKPQTFARANHLRPLSLQSASAGNVATGPALTTKAIDPAIRTGPATEPSIDRRRSARCQADLDRLLIEAAKADNFEEVESLIRDGASTEAIDEEWGPLLHLLVAGNRERMIDLFLKLGANTEVLHNGGTPLHKAVAQGKSGLVESLIKGGADKEAREATEGLTPLHVAASTGMSQIVELLVNLGVTRDPSSKHHLTPLHLAAIPPEKALPSIKTPNVIAMWDSRARKTVQGQIKAIQHLVKSGANLKAANDAGRTPLHEAAIRGHTEVLQCFLELGANPETRDASGMSPMGSAEKLGHQAAFTHLLAARTARVARSQMAGSNPQATPRENTQPQFQADFDMIWSQAGAALATQEAARGCKFGETEYIAKRLEFVAERIRKNHTISDDELITLVHDYYRRSDSGSKEMQEGGLVEQRKEPSLTSSEVVISPGPFCGTWAFDESAVRATIRTEEGRIVVQMWDRVDEEKFDISCVRMTGKVLEFTSKMPSRNHTTNLRVTVLGENELQAEIGVGASTVVKKLHRA